MVDDDNGCSLDDVLFSVDFESVEVCVCCTVVGIDICLVDVSIPTLGVEVFSPISVVEGEVRFLINAVLVAEPVVTEENWLDAYLI